MTLGNWFRMYNQNRFKVWVGIIVIAFILLIIYTLNGIVKNNNNQKISEQQNEENSNINQVDYTTQSQSIIDGGEVSETYQQKFGTLIDSFFTHCKNHEPDEAYDLLSQKCKDILYPTEELFKTQYYEPKFSTEKTYQFQSWSSSSDMIYLVKIYDNMLATGKGNAQKYIQDYVTVVKENDTYKLNVSSFIGVSKRSGKAQKGDIEIEVQSSEMYMDYQIANIVVTNNSPYDFILDSGERTDSTYAVDEKDIKFDAMLFENLDSDLLIKPDEKKEIKIKFSNSYQVGNHIKKYVFSDAYVDDSMDQIYESDEYDENSGSDIKEIIVEVR